LAKADGSASAPPPPQSEPMAGWSPASPREEIRPDFEVSPTGGPRGGPCLVIEADSRDGLDGCWTRTFPVTGGNPADGGVNAAATIAADGQSVQVLVYNHVAGGAASSANSSLVSLTVNNLPFGASGSLRVRHYMIDRTHSNSYQTWVTQGKPAAPSQAQWIALRDTGELCSYTATQTATGGTWTVRYPQNVYGVSLFVLTP